MDAYGCPSDYGELFERYFGMVRRICEQQTARFGGRPEDAEDLVQQVMLRFLEWDGLAKYEPRKLHKGRDGWRTARFPTFLRAFASRFAWDVRDRLQRQGREVLTDFDALGWEGVASYEMDEDVETSVYIQTELAAAWVYLGSVWLSEAVSAADVLDVLVEQATLEGKATAVPIAERFGVSRSVAVRWRRVVLDHLSEQGFPLLAAETY